MAEHGKFLVDLERINNYEFTVRFDNEKFASILVDEPKPLGDEKGPNAARLLGAAVGNCLSASLIFCLEKARHAVKDVRTSVTGTMIRNERGRLRVGKLDVHITLDIDTEETKRLDRCLSLFEDFCVVTASVKKGIDITVLVTDKAGNQLYYNDDKASDD